jgi:hypothetical protein
MLFGGVGEITAGPCGASTAAGASGKHLVDDRPDPANPAPFSVPYEHVPGPIRPCRRTARSTAGRPGATPASGGPTAGASGRPDPLSGPAALSIPAPATRVSTTLRSHFPSKRRFAGPAGALASPGNTLIAKSRCHRKGFSVKSWSPRTDIPVGGAGPQAAAALIRIQPRRNRWPPILGQDEPTGCLSCTQGVRDPVRFPGHSALGWVPISNRRWPAVSEFLGAGPILSQARSDGLIGSLHPAIRGGQRQHLSR